MKRFDFSDIKVDEDTVYIRENPQSGSMRMRDMPKAVFDIVRQRHPGKRIIFKDGDGWYEIITDENGEYLHLSDSNGLPN